MSGIFSYNNKNSTPLRRASANPFCTSPSQLHDVTMENSFRSPPYSTLGYGDSSSPGQGRSLREYEEKMTSLRKENFNLKLKIYFLEEKNPSIAAAADGSESLFKQNVDLKVESESLRKELQEKQELVCQAAKAMEIMEAEQKKYSSAANAKIDELQRKIEFLEMELETIDSNKLTSHYEDEADDDDMMHDDRPNKHQHNVIVQPLDCEALQTHNNQLKINELLNKVDELELQLEEKEKLLDDAREKLEKISYENYELKEKLEENEKSNAMIEQNNLIKLNENYTATLNEILLENQNLKNELETIRMDVSEEKKLTKNLNELMKQNNQLIEELHIKIRNYEETIYKLKLSLNNFKQDHVNLSNEFVSLQAKLNRSAAVVESTNPLDICCKPFNTTTNAISINLSRNHLVRHRPELTNPLYCSKAAGAGDLNSVNQSDEFYTASFNNFINNHNLQNSTAVTAATTTTTVAADRLHFEQQILNRSENDVNGMEQKLLLHPSYNAAVVAGNTGMIETISNKINKITIDIENNEKINDVSVTQSRGSSTDQENSKLKLEIYEIKKTLADKICTLEDTEDKFSEKSTAYDNACLVIHKLTKRAKELENEVDTLRKDQCNNGPVNFEEKHALTSMGDSDKEKDKEILNLKIQMSSLNKEIICLKDCLRKTTICLQTIVNKDYWFKHREIERLEKILNKKISPTQGFKRSSLQLQNSFSEDQLTAAITQNEALQLKLEELFDELETSRIAKNLNNIETEQMRQELNEANNRTTQAIQWQKNCTNVCEILTHHLEELAGFLDTLLNNKDTNIGADRRRAIRKAVDRSLDLSKNLNMSLSHHDNTNTTSNLTTTEQSTFNFDMSNISELINSSHFNSSLHQICTPQNEVTETQKRIIKDLQDEIALLKSDSIKNRKRRESKERKCIAVLEPTDTANNQNSESETWSEPDRNVSQARIGLDVDIDKIKTAKNNETSTESENDGNNFESKKSRQSILKLEEVLYEKENKILMQQCQLVESDNQLKRERLNYNQQIEKLTKQLNLIDSQLNDKIGEIGRLKVELSERSNQIKDYELLKINLRVAETKLATVKNDIEELKLRHRKEVELLKTEHSKSELKLIEVKETYEKLLKNKERDVSENFVQKSEYELLEKEAMRLNKTCQENSERLLEYNKLKDDYKLVEFNSRKLKKQLDELTIQSSKIIQEKTKVMNEKSQIENKQRELEMEIIRLSPRRPCSLNSSRHNLQVLSVSSSESNPENNFKFNRLNNSSPDLGIESDGVVNKFVAGGDIVSAAAHGSSSSLSQQKINHDCLKVEQENIELKKKYVRTRRALEETWTNLKKANQRKEQIEKDIRMQLFKTHNVLKNVRANIESDRNNIRDEEEKEN